ncbi:Phosphate ABC transporter, periplasmic phosphate-binding protein PstS [Rubellimicrobium mesophilum DSM 19309]|uniref:Phosphate ABC transporter, periplasmic phosphate-binding protein PstS n=1 Tax=Rubellimicrobium mesophilum DSM 19309 TaxID=442562 RepID=A0A017HIA4_9RHOB|nr:substrate-binding domain-containing protein [Rubellimicrobium mesophilum]EYD73898.1 Phosphate ABC transporter, periplasmic phosphate-binding protein PstS [Rubellimicrobium mesophilum DSM 19309]
MFHVKHPATALALMIAATPALARDNIQVAGSSTVLPYATIVAEAFGDNFDFPTPVVEGGGTGAGIARFCGGVGEDQIDIANASRPMKASEFESCQRNGVTDIEEVRIGYDGIVFASRKDGPAFAFTPEQWYDALAAEVVQDGQLVANPYTNWSQIDPSLPDQEILAFIPGTKHGTREVFEQKVIDAGCEASGAKEAFAATGQDEDAVTESCAALRTDGLSNDIDGDYNETLARLEANPDAIGVFGLAFYENNTDKLQVATMSGVTPSTETVSSGEYPVSRPLFFYVKKAHVGVIPGLQEFVEFFVSDDVAGEGGPLAEYGLVSDPELAATQAAVADEAVMAAPTN